MSFWQLYVRVPLIPGSGVYTWPVALAPGAGAEGTPACDGVLLLLVPVQAAG